MAQAASGQPTRFITITVNPRVGNSPADRLLRLSLAWRTVIKQLRRAHPGKAIEYLAIVEATKAGEPHLHILFRGPYVPQGWLSTAFQRLLQSPIVDIRRIKNGREVIRYVAKYITKAPAQFGTAKRYWCSRGYSAPYEPPDDEETLETGTWAVDQRNIATILQEWFTSGWIGHRDNRDGLICWPAPPDSPYYARTTPR